MCFANNYPSANGYEDTPSFLLFLSSAYPFLASSKPSVPVDRQDLLEDGQPPISLPVTTRKQALGPPQKYRYGDEPVPTGSSPYRYFWGG